MSKYKEDIEKLAKPYIRVGDNYLKKIKKLDQLGHEMYVWEVRQLSTIKVETQVKDIAVYIKGYDSFCNVPQNMPGTYTQEIKGLFNLYNEITHVPTPGEFPTIERFLKHVFRDIAVSDYSTRYDVFMDWITILYRHPTQKLPIISLVSEENNTGKSTVLDLLKFIFEENAGIYGNAEISSDFNAVYASKLLVMIDEAFIEKQVILERIKSMNTLKQIWCNDKGMKNFSIPCVAHFCITSNNEDNFVKMDSNDSRFWVLKVNKVDRKDYDPDMFEKMKNEVPAFLYHIQTREILHPKKDRFWFSPELLVTEEKRNMIVENRTKIEKVLHEWVTNQFLNLMFFPLDERPKELHFSLDKLKEQIKGTNYIDSDIKKVIQKKWNLQKLEGVQRRDIYTVTPEGDTYTTSIPGRYYIFPAEKFLTSEDMAQVYTTQTPQTISVFNQSGAVVQVPATHYEETQAPF